MQLLSRLPADLDALHREEQYRFLTEKISDVIWTLGLDRRLTYVSPPVEALTGFTPDEAKSMSLSDLLTPASLEITDKAFIEHLERERDSTADANRSCTLDLELRHKDGTRVWIEAKMSFLREPTGIPCGILGVARDITSWKNAQQALEVSQNQLRRVERMEAIGQLAGGIAHDFNNLLTVILGNGQLLIAELDRDQPGHVHAEELLLAANKAAGLTRQLLNFSHQRAPAAKAVDVNLVIQEVEPMLRRLIGENIELRVRLDRGVTSVVADPSQLEQVIMNLAVNARDAMPRGGQLTLETAKRPYARSQTEGRIDTGSESFAMIAATDNGCGIEGNDLDKIFEPFFTTKTGKGTGLGLATVFGIVERSGGHIWVASEPGEGSRFEIYLPLAPRGERSASLREVASDAGSGTETLLVVEDEQGVRNLVCRVLEDQGYRVLKASCAGEAISILEDEQSIDLMITDIVMPGESGYELARRVSKRKHNLNLLFISGHPDDVLVENGRAEAIGNFLSKPFSPAELSKKVRAILDQAQCASSPTASLQAPKVLSR